MMQNLRNIPTSLSIHPSLMIRGRAGDGVEKRRFTYFHYFFGSTEGDWPAASQACVGGLCRRTVSKVSVYATYATYATYARHRGTLADFIFFLN